MKNSNISKEKRNFSQWLIRQYFDSEKNENSPWYCENINPENVVLKLKSGEIKNFPYTFSEISHMWKLIDSVKKSFKDKPEESQPSEYEVGGKKMKYQTGEVTLRDIGKNISGGVTPTMINNILFSGTSKLKKLIGNVALDDMGVKESRDLDIRIMKIRKEASRLYSKELLESGGDINKFFCEINRKKIVSKSETKYASKTEIDGLGLLASKESRIAQAILLEDLENNDNIFKTFQSAVSKKAFLEIN
jgi:hypothetical protein